MAWQKSSAELIARFDACLPDDPLVERRQMFGYPCAFVNGNMFVDLHEQNLIVRLDDTGRERAVAQAQAKPFVVMGKAMREYMAIGDAPLRKQSEVAALMKTALSYARGLAPKIKKPSKAATEKMWSKLKPKLRRQKPLSVG